MPNDSVSAAPAKTGDDSEFSNAPSVNAATVLVARWSGPRWVTHRPVVAADATPAPTSNALTQSDAATLRTARPRPGGVLPRDGTLRYERASLSASPRQGGVVFLRWRRAARRWAAPAFPARAPAGRQRYKIVTNRKQLTPYCRRMRPRIGTEGGLTHTARSNVAVKRVVGAFAALTVGEWVLGTTVAIPPHPVGGALLVGLVGFRFFPAAIAGLVTAQFADTHRREMVLTATAGVRALTSALAAGALALKLPFAIPLLLVWFDAAAGSAYRPAQATLLPTLVHTPTEFTHATALASHAKSSSQMLGALAGGLLV